MGKAPPKERQTNRWPAVRRSVYLLRNALAIAQIGANGDWLMDQNGSRRIFVALPSGCSVSEIDLLKLLSEAEIDLSSVHFANTEPQTNQIAAQDALVIVLMDNQVIDPLLDSAVLSAARAGVACIVGVWAPGQTEKGIHPAVLQFGTSQVPWSSDRLKNELGSDCENVFQNADGEIAEANEIDPHECE